MGSQTHTYSKHFLLSINCHQSESQHFIFYFSKVCKRPFHFLPLRPGFLDFRAVGKQILFQVCFSGDAGCFHFVCLFGWFFSVWIFFPWFVVVGNKLLQQSKVELSGFVFLRCWHTSPEAYVGEVFQGKKVTTASCPSLVSGWPVSPGASVEWDPSHSFMLFLLCSAVEVHLKIKFLIA